MEQHPPCSLQGCLDQLSRIYSAGQGQPLVLDTRPSQVYHQQRLQGAANVPLLHLRARCFLLPDKNTPFVVLIPSNDHYTIVNDQQQHGQVQDDGSTSICLAGTSGLEEFLTSRRWQVSCALQDVPCLWEAAAQLQLLEGPLSPALLARRWLFRPAAILEQNINRVEQLLLSQRVQAGRSSGHHRVFRALDLGCGSGRDVVWLASRHRTAGDAGDCAGGLEPAAGTNHADSPQQAAQTAAEGQVAHLCSHDSAATPMANGPQGAQPQGASCHEQQQEQQVVAPPEVMWQVVGLDEWHGALVRGQQLAEQAGLPPMATCWCMARVDPVTGQLVQLALPAGSPLAQQAPACTWTGEAAAGDGCAADSDGLQLGSFDLLLCVRFLERALLPVLPSLLRPGGVLLYCTFVEGPGLAAYGRPTGRDRVLAPGELRTWFGEQQGFKVLQDEVVLSDDGRELSMYAAVKL